MTERLERMYPGLSALAKKRALLVPTHISWRRAARLVKAGFASLDPFHQRWQGRLEITDRGAACADGEAASK